MDFSAISGIDAFPPYLNPFLFNEAKRKVSESKCWLILYFLPESLPFGLEDWYLDWCNEQNIPLVDLTKIDESDYNSIQAFSGNKNGVILSHQRLNQSTLDLLSEFQEIHLLSLRPWASRWEHYNLCLISQDLSLHQFALDHRLIYQCSGHPGLIYQLYLTQKENPFWNQSQFQAHVESIKRQYILKFFPELNLQELALFKNNNFKTDSESQQALLNSHRKKLILEDGVHGNRIHPLFLSTIEDEPPDEPLFWMGYDQKLEIQRLSSHKIEPIGSIQDLWTSQLNNLEKFDSSTQVEELSECLEILVELSAQEEFQIPYFALIQLKNLATQSQNPWWRHKFLLILMDYYLLHSSRLEIEKLILDRYSDFVDLGHSQAMSEFLLREGIHHYLSDLKLLAIHLCFSANEVCKDKKSKQDYHCYSLLMSLTQPHCDWGIGLREMESNIESTHQAEVCFLHAILALGQSEERQFEYWRDQLFKLQIGNYQFKSFLLPFLDYLSHKARLPFEPPEVHSINIEVLHGKQKLFWSKLLKDLDHDWNTMINLNGNCRLINSSTLRIERDRYQNYDLFFDYIQNFYWIKGIGKLNLVRSRVLLLLFFIFSLRPGHRFSFQSLYELVWGEKFKPELDEQTVRTALARLKKAIESEKDQRIGVGLTDGKHFLRSEVQFCVLLSSNQILELTPIVTKLNSELL